jgi:hypothetical protein
VGFWAIPPVGANVWIEFEGGDPSHPIWSGGFWELGEFPAPMTFNPLLPQLVCLWKTAFATLALNDTPALGGVTLSVTTPAVALPITMTFTSEGAKVTIGATTMLLTGVTIQLTTTDLSATATAGIAHKAGATFAAQAGADASVQAGGAVAIKAGGNANVEAGAAVAIKAAGNAAMQAAGSAEVSAAGGADLKAGGAVQVLSGTNAIVTAGGALTLSGRAATVAASAVSFVPG